jgi:alpha-1,2-mannosyltransferase
VRPDSGGLPPFTPPRWLLVPGLAVFAVSAAAVLLVSFRNLDPYDLRVYLMGGEAWRHGLPVYDQTVSSQWGVGYFTYPPATLVAFGPLSTLPLGAVHAIMAVAGVLSLAAVAWLVLRSLGCRLGAGATGLVLAITGGALWLQPVYDSLQQGQINLILMLLVVADLALAGSRRWPTGVGIGVATAVKMTPGIFIIYLLLTRRFRAAAVAAGTTAAATAVGLAAAPGDSVRFWFRGTFFDAARVAMPLTPDADQSIHGMALRVFGAERGAFAWLLLAAIVAVIGLWTAVALSRTLTPMAGGLVCAITGLLISPLTWGEHWVWIVSVVMVLAYFAWRYRDRSPFLLPAVGIIAAVPFLMWPLPTNANGGVAPASILGPTHHLWEDKFSRNPVVGLADSAYVLVGIALLILAVWAVRRSRRVGEPIPPAAEPAMTSVSAR